MMTHQKLLIALINFLLKLVMPLQIMSIHSFMQTLLYEGSETVVRCAVGTTESFKVKIGLHQGSVLSPFLFAVIMDRQTDEVRREPPWTMLFANDIVICKETREEVEQRIEC